MVTAGVDICTLLIHHVVIFEKTLTDTEVVFLHALLGVFDCAGHHAALNHLTLLEAESIKHLHHTVGGEESHQLVFK